MSGIRWQVSERGASVPAVVELLAGALLVAVCAWRLASPEGALAGMISGSMVGTAALMVVLLVGVALFYLGLERIRDERRAVREEEDDRL